MSYFGFSFVEIKEDHPKAKKQKTTFIQNLLQQERQLSSLESGRASKAGKDVEELQSRKEGRLR